MGPVPKTDTPGLWSCRELNPGPVKPIPDFLHAYPSLDFRRDPGGRRAEDHA